jgi:glutamate/tyrosine decarboxylase-like PLP-dependent enzyme
MTDKETSMSRTDEYTRVLKATLEYAIQHIERLDQDGASAGIGLGELRARLTRPLPERGQDPCDVITSLIEDTRGGIIASPGPRFFAWVVGGTLPAALAADWITSTWDQNAAIHASAPAAAVIEEVTGNWLKQLLGLPPDASFSFVTGTQMAHVTCLAAARHRLLERLGWNVEEHGLFGAPTIRIITSSEHHGSLDRAARLLGLGKNAIHNIPCNEAGELEADALERELDASPRMATIVVLQAGDLNIGAFDSFARLAPLARKHGAWIHVDGAFGLWVAASRRHRSNVRGVELADSWTTDGHKWLNTPFDCGYAFVSDRAAHSAALSHQASYLVDVAGTRDELHWNPEWSRRARAIPTYAALLQLGSDGVEQLIDRCCDYAALLVNGIGALRGAEVVSSPRINQGLVRFLDSRPGASDDDHDRMTNRVIARIVDQGEAYFGGTTWRGMRCMRVSVCSWQTDLDAVDRTVAAVRNVLDEEATASGAES